MTDLESSWKKLGESALLPMQEYGWNRLCAEKFSVRSLKILTVRGAHGPEKYIDAIAPFKIGKAGFGLRRLTLLGVEELNEPTDLLHVNEASLRLLCEAIVETGMPVTLRRIRADSRTLPLLKRAIAGRGWAICRPDVAYPFLQLDESWLKPELRLNPGRRSDLRRALRRARETGPISVEILSPSISDFDRLLDAAYRIEGRSWKGDAGTALEKDGIRGAFYREYLREACEEGILRLSFLKIEGCPVAMQLALQCRNAFWLLKIGYDPRFGRCSPGTLLMMHTIRFAAEQGLGSYEFLGTSESWTRIWTARDRECVSIRLYPRSWIGVATLASDAMTSVLAKFEKRGAHARHS